MRFHYFTLLLITILFIGCGNNDGNYFLATGIVEGTAVKVAAQTGGYILNIFFDEGKDVEQGEIIAVVDTEKLVYQLQQVEAGLEEVKVQHEINLNTVERTKLDYEHFKRKYERYQDLYEKKSATKQVVDDLKRAYDNAKTQYEIARQNLKVVQSKQKALEAQLNLLQRRIKDATIITPISGTVTTKYYEAGETIPTGAAVVEIIDLEKMWTKIYVSELLLPKVKVGQQAEIRIDGTNQTLTGYISWISPRAEFTPKNILTKESRTSLVYAVKVNIDNPDRILKHGMPVEVNCPLSIVN